VAGNLPAAMIPAPARPTDGAGRLESEPRRRVSAGTRSDGAELRALQRKLSLTEARFRSLTRLSSAWYWEQDADLRFVDTMSRSDERAGS